MDAGRGAFAAAGDGEFAAAHWEGRILAGAGGGSGWRDGDGPDLCGAQEPGGDSGGAGKDPPRRQSEGDREGLKPRTLEFAKFIIVFTTFPEDKFSAEEVLECYRLRWQVELVFKRFKSLAQLGHLPKYDDDSARAWLYGKLLLALLVEKLIRHAESVSPWGYDLPMVPAAQHLA